MLLAVELAEWHPDSTTGKVAFEVDLKGCKRLDTDGQALVAALLLNRFPGVLYKCTRCDEVTTRGHIRRCRSVRELAEIDWSRPAKKPLILLKCLKCFREMMGHQEVSGE